MFGSSRRSWHGLGACALGLVAAGCLAPESSESEIGATSQPLIGGTVATEDPAVIALTTNNRPFCTGTLISPSVILTAAHCIDMAGADPNITIFFGTDTYSEGQKIGVKKTSRHPGWNGNLGQFDIGLMLMNFPQDPEMALPLNTSAAGNHVGEPYRVVGFGISERGEAADGKKREATSTISSVTTSGDIIITGDDMVSVCFGDSGGPGFISIDGVEHVAGVHSYTSSSNCFPPNGDTRVDPYVEDFILPWIQANDPVCGADNKCARIGCIDDPDCQPCGPDGTCTTECPLPDPDCKTQELGELCVADTQCTTDLCVYWQGDPSTRFCSRPCDPAASDCPSGMSCKSVQPFGNICYYDADPPGVIGSPCEQPTDCGSYLCDQGYCVTTCDLSIGKTCPTGFECTSSNGADFYCHGLDEGEGGGCGCQSGGHPGLAGLLLALLALAPTWRRRRAPTSRSRS